MKYDVAFEIQPAGNFGVPEGSKIVFPASLKEYIGDTYHVKTMTRAGYGTLSRYREDDNKIHIKLNFEGINGRITDNFLFLNVEANTGREAFDKAVGTVDRFLQFLSLNMKQFFSHKILYVVPENGEPYPLPKGVHFSVTGYNLDELRTAILSAEGMYKIVDPVLDKAIQYYEHALFLFTNMNIITDFLSRHFRHLNAALFLNLWKAVSVVVGDPSIDRDYQKRYKKLGFDHNFFKSNIEFVRDIRNKYDIAHYHLDPDKIGEIEQNFGKCKEITEIILRVYCEYLMSGNPSLSKPNKTSKK